MGGGGGDNDLLSWCFEPSQAQRIILGLKTNFSLSASYSAHKSTNHKFSKIDKISPDTNLFKTKHTYTNIKQIFFRRMSPFSMALFKNKVHKRPGHAGIADHSVDLSIPEFLSIKKRNGQTPSEKKKII